MNDGERYRRGVELLRRVGGPDFDAPLKALADVAPDLVRFAVEFGYGDIMSRPDLDLRTRQLATVAALAAMGNAEPQLRYHIDGALNVECVPAHVVETILLADRYAGSGAATSALRTAQEVFAQRGLKFPIDAGTALHHAADENALSPRLDPRTRAIVTVALLTALGRQADLRSHVGAALDAGAARAEVVEAIQQMALYAGFPAALNGIAAARAVLVARTPASIADRPGEQSTG